MGRAGDIFSYSRLSTLDNCPRAYEFRYVRKLKEAFTSVESFVGRIVHHTLGWMYSERERSGAPTEAAAVEKFDQEWDGRFGSWVRVIRRDDSAEARRAIGQEMVRRYHRGAFAEDDLRTVGVERRLDVDLEGGRRYRGIVDRLAEDGEGALHVVDFKTTARPPATHDEQ